MEVAPFESDFTDGNVLLGGLPRHCGPEVVVEFLEALEELGRYADLEALEEELHETARRDAAIHRTIAAATARLAAGEKVPLQERQSTIANDARDELTHLWLEFHERHLLVLTHEFEAAWSQLARYVLQSGGGLVPALSQLSEAEVRYWSLDELLRVPHRNRVADVQGLLVLAGLHELNRNPWSSLQGGLHRTRGTSAEYAGALRRLHPDVLDARFVGDLLSVYEPMLPEYCRNARDLLELALEFEVRSPLARLLKLLSQAYVSGEKLGALILARSVLESTAFIVCTHEGVEDGGPGDMFARLRTLESYHLISPGALDAAHKVRIRGNKAAHAGQTADTLDTIRLLLHVLQEFRPAIEAP